MQTTHTPYNFLKAKFLYIYFVPIIIFLVSFCLLSDVFQTAQNIDPTPPTNTSLYDGYSFFTTARNHSKNPYVESADTSIIHLPIEVAIAEVAAEINQNLPDGSLLHQDTIYKPGKHNKKFKNKIRVRKLSPFQLRMEGDYIYAHVDLGIQASVKYGNKPEKLAKQKPLETEAQIRVYARSKLSINPNWQLLTRTEIIDYQWLEEPEVNILGMPVSITPIAELKIAELMPRLLPKIDAKAKYEVDVKQAVRTAWIALQQTYRVNEQPDIWFKITPTQVLVSPLTSYNDTLKLSIGVKVFAETIIDEQPNYAINTQLPELQLLDAIQSKFSIKLIGTISYERANKIINEQLRGYTHHFLKGKHMVQVEDVQVYPSDEQLIVKLSITGAAKGKLYLSGTPRYDIVNQSLYVEDFDFDIQTKNILVKVASWLKHKNFINTLKERLYLPLGHQIVEAECQIQEFLRTRKIGKNIVLDGILDKLEPKQIQLTDNLVKAVVRAEGNAAIQIAQK